MVRDVLVYTRAYDLWIHTFGHRFFPDGLTYPLCFVSYQCDHSWCSTGWHLRICKKNSRRADASISHARKTSPWSGIRDWQDVSIFYKELWAKGRWLRSRPKQLDPCKRLYTFFWHQVNQVLPKELLETHWVWSSWVWLRICLPFSRAHAKSVRETRSKNEARNRTYR